MEKDNKSLPMREFFPNTVSSFPIESKVSNATTSLQTIHRHPRLTDVQVCSNEIIDLTAASMMPVNLNAQARPYELTKINNNMMSIYDVNSPNSNVVTSFGVDKGSSKQCLDILQGISKGNKNQFMTQLRRRIKKC